MNTLRSMTPRERFLSAVHNGPVDRTAVGSVTSVANLEQMEMTGAYFPDVHLSGPLMARLAAGAHTILGYDVIMPVFSVTVEAAALGAEIDWGERETMPACLNAPWEDPAQVRIPSDLLDREPTRAVLEAIRLLRAEYGGRVAIAGKVMGPWTLAYHMHGVQAFLLETLTDPGRVRAFLKALEPVTVQFGRGPAAGRCRPAVRRGSRHRRFDQPAHVPRVPLASPSRDHPAAEVPDGAPHLRQHAG